MTSDREFKRAVLDGNSARTGQLLADGVNANASFNESSTALHHAAGNGHLSLIRLLLERGAKVNAQDSTGATPLHWAATMGNVEAGKLLLESGATVDAQTTKQNTPLHRAARHGRAEMARLLLDHGADRSLRNADDHSPSELATEAPHEPALKQELLSVLSEGVPTESLLEPKKPTKRSRSGSKRPKPRQH